MSRPAKTLLICVVIAFLAPAGCRKETDEKILPSKDDASTEEAKRPSEDQDEPESKHESVVKIEKGPKGHTIRVETPQGLLVELPGDHDPWADRVVSFKMGNPAAKICKNPQTTIGKPDYSLKRQGQTCLSMGHKGELVLEFVDNRLVDGPGDDLVVFEVGPVVEPMDVAISVDGKDWISVGRLKGAKCTVDIGPYLPTHQRYRDRPAPDRPLFRFVKITDAGAGLSNKSDKAGADIDAVGALNSVAAP